LEESKNKKQQEIENIISSANEEFQLYLNKKMERKKEYDKKYQGIKKKSAYNIFNKIFFFNFKYSNKPVY